MSPDHRWTVCHVQASLNTFCLFKLLLICVFVLTALLVWVLPASSSCSLETGLDQHISPASTDSQPALPPCRAQIHGSVPSPQVSSTTTHSLLAVYESVVCILGSHSQCCVTTGFHHSSVEGIFIITLWLEETVDKILITATPDLTAICVGIVKEQITICQAVDLRFIPHRCVKLQMGFLELD